MTKDVYWYSPECLQPKATKITNKLLDALSIGTNKLSKALEESQTILDENKDDLSQKT